MKNKIGALALIFGCLFLFNSCDNSNSVNNSTEKQVNNSPTNYVVGNPIMSKENIFGTYCDKGCNFYIVLGSMSDLEHEVKGLSKKNKDFAKSNSWDGYAFINKGGGITGVGFWQIKKMSPIIQNFKYPSITQGKEFNGADILLHWMPSETGLETYPDGIYQIVNSPNGIYYIDEQSPKTSYKVFLCGTDGGVKFEKNK